MKMIKRILSMFLIFVLVLSVSAGTLITFAEQTPADAAVLTPAPTEELPLTQTLPPAVTADGHIDAEITKQWVDAYLKENNWDKPGVVMGIAFWYSGTDETWFYNADEWMYGINWYKLPVCMFFAEKLKSGEMTKDSIVTGITLEYALNTVLEYTSGPSVWALVTYLTEELGIDYHDVAKQYAGLPDSYYDDSYYTGDFYTARLMMEITKTLYEGGEERFPGVLEDMKKSQPEDIFKRDWVVRTSWDVAQQHAAYWSDLDDLIHGTGVFYTPTPMVLTVMTKNIWDLDIIGGVAGHFGYLAVDLDNAQHPEKAEASEADNSATDSSAGNEAATSEQSAGVLPADAESSNSLESVPEASPAPADQERSDSDAANESQSSDETQPSDLQSEAEIPPPEETQAPVESTEPKENSPSLFRKNPFLPILVLIIILIIFIIIAIVIAVRKRKEQERRRRTDRLLRQRERERQMREQKKDDYE